MAVYSNFRSGTLKQGQPLGMTSTAVNLNVDSGSPLPPVYYNPDVSVGVLNLYSTGTNKNDPTKRNITINTVDKFGYELYVVFNSSVPQPQLPTPPVAGDATATVTFNSFGLVYTWVPTHEGDYMILMSNGTDWTLINNVVGGAAVGGGLSYQGTWNATTNTPTLSDPPLPATNGFYYVVSTGGTQFTITWNVGDWIVSNGAAWQKVDNTDLVSSVFGRTGAVVASIGDYTAAQVSNTPAGGLSAVTVQAAVDELDVDKLGTALTDGQIFVGDVTNNAAPVAVTGDVTISNAGVTAIASGVIVNDDVNASAAIALSKLAAATATRALVSDAAGLITAATTTATEVGYVNGVTSAIQTQLNAKIGTTLTTGSILVGVAGVATELAAGAEGQFLKITGGVPAWTTFP